MHPGKLIACFLLIGAAASTSVRGAAQLEEVVKARTGKVLSELSTAEQMVEKELHGHPRIMQEEMGLLHKAEDVFRRGREKHSTKLIQQTSQAGAADATGKVLGELSAAEGMLQKELHGHPQVLQQEMHFLHQAEDAARHRTHVAADSPGLLQQKEREGTTVATGQMLDKLNKVENMVEKVLSGHPKELKEEEKALHQAQSAAQALQNPQAGALVEVTKASYEQLEEQRSRSVAAAFQEERSYGKAEHQLSKDGEKILAEFGNAEDSVAQAFAGRDSKAVKTAMQVGELLEKARDEQQHVTSLNAAEAAKADKKASALASAFAQTTAEGKAAQEQRAYIAGMSSLAKDEKASLSQFAGIKSAVAKAFAGQDSKAVEKAMQVGELLDEARSDQQHVAERDAKAATDASDEFHRLASHVPHHTDRKAFLQTKGRSTTEARAAHALRMQSLASRQTGILHMTEHAEDAITRELARDGGHAAMATEHEVISILEQAKHAEQAAYTAAAQAAHVAKA
mmetsp:Transcript_87614/g.165160  ORF Transcript_87614/g.165160 Transcript_87614/m.165160 type:complete len:512 (-) Transcript_87614:63-1598(-)